MDSNALKRKKQILQVLLERTKHQETLLKDEEMDPEEFNATIEEKGTQIEELNKIDEGFDGITKVAIRLLENALSPIVVTLFGSSILDI